MCWSMFLPLNSTATSRKWFLSNLACSLAEKGFCACEQCGCSVSSDHVWFIKLEFNELSDHSHLPLNQSHAASWKLWMKVLLTTLSSALKFLPSTSRGTTDLFPMYKMAPSTVFVAFILPFVTQLACRLRTKNRWHILRWCSCTFEELL